MATGALTCSSACRPSPPPSFWQRSRSCRSGSPPCAMHSSGPEGAKRMQQYDVVGIGNAIVDIIGRCDDAFLTRHGRRKGSMQLVDAAAIGALYEAMGPGVEISGGSVANTLVGVASLGGRAAFIGKNADAHFGDIVVHVVRDSDVICTTDTT